MKTCNDSWSHCIRWWRSTNSEEPYQQNTFAWRNLNSIRIGCSSCLANRACASCKDCQSDRYHWQTMAPMYELVFVYERWCGPTAHVFDRGKPPECVKSYRWLALCLFPRKTNFQPQPHGAKISLKQEQAWHKWIAVVRTLLHGILWLADGELEIFCWSGFRCSGVKLHN